jgi:O-antigen/teichoic acid export membrane protein
MAFTGVMQLMKRNTAWLYAGEILPRIVSLFIVPIWSSRVVPEEFARWVLALTSTEIFIELGGLGLATFLTKVLYRYHDERAQRYFGMGARVLLITTGLGASIMAVSSPWLSRLIIGSDVRTDLFMYLAIYVVAAQFTNLAVLYLGSRVQYDYGPFFLMGMLRWLFSTGLLLLFLLVWRQGFYSWVWASVGTEVLLIPISAYHLRHVQWRWRNRHMLRFALRFSLPTVATNLLSWGQNRVGRYVVSFSGPAAGVGLYGIAQNFSQHYGAVVRPAKIVALRILGHALEEDPHSPYYLEFFHGFACLALSIAFLLAMFLGDIMKLFVAQAYWGAAISVPPLVFMFYMSEMYSLYHSLMFRYFKAWFTFWGMLVAFVSVTTATVLLVPSLGFFGAALAQLIGNTAMVVFAHWYATSVSRRAFRFGEKTVFTAVALILSLLCERMAFSTISKIAMAFTVLTPYLLLHWHHRRNLFPVAAGMIAAHQIGVATSISPPSGVDA